MMSNVGKRILLIDDDAELVELLSIKLSKHGYAVTITTKPEDGYLLAIENEYDAIVLDLIMPRLSGAEVCSRWRSRGMLTPVIMLSGQAEKDVVVLGLNAGADDYLTKPFDEQELIARITALQRRNRKSFNADHMDRGGIRLDIALHAVHYNDRTIILTPKEVLLLKRLMAEAPKAVSRSALLQDVWGISGDHASNRLDVYIRRLRQKFQIDGGGGCIHTVRNGGYYFDPVRRTVRHPA